MCKKELTKISFVLSVLLLSFFSRSFSQQIQSSREYQIKAVFLFNLTQFVEWPKNSFDNDQAPLIIGIIGKDPFGVYLDEVISGEKINDHTISIQHFAQVDDIKTCHILFVNTESDVEEKILTGVKGRNILTVGDTKDFIKRKGMLRFVTENNKTKIQINMEAVKGTELTISSKLLRLAEIVSP